jgi:hypothetical protein
MKALAIVMGGLILVAFLTEWLNLLRVHQRRERDREREASNLSHITGTKRWWREPPSDGPEGDH